MDHVMECPMTTTEGAATMSTTEKSETCVQDDVVELGSVARETKGILRGQEANGGDIMPGLSEQ